MRLLKLVLATGSLISGLAPAGLCQDKNAEENKAQPNVLHFLLPFPEGYNGRFFFTASSAQWVHPEGKTYSILQLRGNVEVRTMVCETNGHVCVKSPYVLRADAVDYNRKTGEIDAPTAMHGALAGPWPEGKLSASR